MNTNIDPDDVVVAELDVVLSNELAGLQSQLVMLQQPLRPNWRAYDAGAPGSSAKLKPNARRLEITLPLDTQSGNYQEMQDEQKRIKTLQLRSSQVEDPVSSYAVGVIKGNQLVLVPLDFALQLRPNMAYLQPTPEPPGKGIKADAADESDDEDAAGEQLVGRRRRGAAEGLQETCEELTAVEVTVKRRETERQQQMRLKSFSYMQQEEQQEAWVPLTVVPSDSAAADKLWDKLLSPDLEQPDDPQQQQQQQQQQRRRPQPVQLSRTEYLHAFAPSTTSAEFQRDMIPLGGSFSGALPAAAAAAAAGALAAAAAAGGVGGASVSPSPSPAPEGFEGAAVLPEGMAKAVKPFIKSLFKRHTVCSMANVRQWLQQQGDAQSLAAAALDDQLLHAVLTGSGYATNLRRVYIARDGPHCEAQELRQVALEVLGMKQQIRKGDVVKLAKERGIHVSDTLFGKVSKELCKNNGSYWLLKTGADM